MGSGVRVAGNTKWVVESSNCGTYNIQASFLVFTGVLGEMPASKALQGLPVISSTQAMSTVVVRVPNSAEATPGKCRTTTDASMTWSRLGSQPSIWEAPQHTQGVYVGAGNSPVSSKLADRIRHWEFIDMADLLPEVRLSDREGEPEKLLQRRPRCVTDIWSWLHCFGTYVSVLGPAYPQAIPELMAYMSLIIRCNQDYEGLAWVRYDMSFRRQAAASGNRNWSEVNSTLYSVCFTGHEGTLSASYAWRNHILQITVLCKEEA